MATIENKEKEHKQSQQGEKQVFYFNDEGKLVVETNKGVWVDGEKFVKMIGEFVCNAKTLGTIVGQLKGIKVEIGNETTRLIDRSSFYSITSSRDILKETSYCVLGVDDERVSEIIEKKSEERAKELKEGEENKYLEILKEQNKELADRNYSLSKSIDNYNNQPWWKRMFKKIEVK